MHNKISTLSKISGFCLAVMLGILGLSATAHAEGYYSNEYAKSGFYIGYIFPYNSVRGSFSGDEILYAGNELILIPKFQDASGFGVAFGGKFSKGAIEFTYLKSKHSISWMGAEGTATYQMVTIDFKRFFLNKRRTQPFILAGASFPWITADDCAADYYNTGDANFRGIGLNVGGGLSFYFHPRISLSAGAVYRLIFYTTAKGVGGEWGELEDLFWGNGLNSNVSLNFTF